MEDYYLKLKKQSNELFKVSIAAIIYVGVFSTHGEKNK